MRFFRLTLVAIAIFTAAVDAAEPPVPMKFNDVREIAPGVFFRYSSISATDKSIPFGGSNNIWFVFDEYVVVFDANFPKEAGDVIAAVRKTTDKPIRYVLDSHHHGDHAYGNDVWGKQGATIIASKNAARLLRVNGPKEFEGAGKGPAGRKDVAESRLRVPDLIFDDKLVLDDGKHRVEFHFLGHAHTPGDAVCYVPEHKILCTGDACVNGAFNFMGHSDSVSWIKVLDRMQTFDVKLVCPGHGLPWTPDLIKKQQRYFVELREQVKKGIDAGKEFDDILKSMDMPWQKEWTGLDVKDRKDNVRHVYDELTGRVTPLTLLEDLKLPEGPPTKTAGWTPPRKIVVPALMPARLLELKRLAPEILFVPARTVAEAAREAADADAVLGFCTPEILQAGRQLRWVQADRVAAPGRPLALTSLAGVKGSSETQWLVFRENVRRFVAGEPLLGVVQR